MMLDKLEPPPQGAPFAVTTLGARPAPPTEGAWEGGPSRPAVLWVAAGDGHRHFWVELRSFDVRMTSDLAREPFRTRQARLGFESGWTISVVWGSCTYSSNHDAGFVDGPPFTETPATVELAVLDRGGTIVNPDQEPFGYLGPAGVLAVIDCVAAFPSGAEGTATLALLREAARG